MNSNDQEGLAEVLVMGFIILVFFVMTTIISLLAHG